MRNLSTREIEDIIANHSYWKMNKKEATLLFTLLGVFSLIPLGLIIGAIITMVTGDIGGGIGMLVGGIMAGAVMVLLNKMGAIKLPAQTPKPIIEEIKRQRYIEAYNMAKEQKMSDFADLRYDRTIIIIGYYIAKDYELVKETIKALGDTYVPYGQELYKIEKELGLTPKKKEEEDR